jgi:hypothetical protein
VVLLTMVAGFILLLSCAFVLAHWTQNFILAGLMPTAEIDGSVFHPLETPALIEKC